MGKGEKKGSREGVGEHGRGKEGQINHLMKSKQFPQHWVSLHSNVGAGGREFPMVQSLRTRVSWPQSAGYRKLWCLTGPGVSLEVAEIYTTHHCGGNRTP